MFTKGYSRRVGLHNWEPSGLRDVPGLPPVTAAALPGSRSGPGCEGTVKESKLWRLQGGWEGSAGDGGAGSGAGPVGSPAADARPQSCPAFRSSPTHKRRRSSSSLFQ